MLSSTVSSGSSRRPSGTIASPAWRIFSGRRPASSRPSSVTDPPSGLQHAADREHEARLAGAVRPEQRRDLARVRSSSETLVHDRVPAARDAEVREAERAVAHAPAPRVLDPRTWLASRRPPRCRGRRGSRARRAAPRPSGRRRSACRSRARRSSRSTPDTRLMSWSTRIVSAPISLGDPADHLAEVLGLLVG